MCRILSAAVFLVSICSVFSAHECQRTPSILAQRASVMVKFTETVDTTLRYPNDSEDLVNEFGSDLNTYFHDLREGCNSTEYLNITAFIDLVKFSLRNNTFRVIIDDQDCIKSIERNISHCVESNAGVWNISSKKKHTHWLTKVRLNYDTMTCRVAELVKNCVSVRLNYCKPPVAKYVTSLFDFTLKNCPEPTNKTSPNKAPKLSEPVTITLGLGAVLLMQLTHLLRN
nr:uncharacterized protein LOC110375015 [Helicoverpa armigera]